MRLPLQRRLFFSHFLAVVLVSGSIGTLFYRSAVDSLFGSLQSRLQHSAALLARSLDAAALEGIRTPADTALVAYQEHLQKLRDFQAANQDIAFIYIMRRDGDAISFVVDSDASPRQALPGQPYTSPTPWMLEGFDHMSVDQKISRDEWGAFLSGFAPLRNGKGRILIGIDMRADEVQRKFRTIHTAGAVSLAFSVLLAYLFSLWLAHRIVEPLRLLSHRASDIAAGRLGGQVEVPARDEVGDLAKAFNTMSGALEASQAENERVMEELEHSRATLEQRVAERTQSLADANARLTAEIRERERIQEQLSRAATTDYLTGLLNRPAMLVMLVKEIERARRHGQVSALLLCDLDGFKEVNDESGHEVGDQVLIAVARRLQAAVRAQDVIARWGGDEMLILLPGTSAAGAREVAEKLRAAFAGEPIRVAGREVAVTLSLGGTVIDGSLPMREVIHRADVACYQAKSAGRNRAVLA
ncbi:MAG TPA: diguanylate cyclase [Thermoanaerobaculaceae bacterium]|nr:diguanylate cyclase [Thermoanaerobaculaceae bacterium]HRS16138.1 diguanylate cyclase [Thermoanaerobaculaceae bacterium]